MKQSLIDQNEANMDLNVLVLGGSLGDRNALTTLIADTLHQQGFGAVSRETTGEVETSSMSILDAIQDTRPHLFSEAVHVIAVASDQGLIVADEDNADSGNTLMVMMPTRQPPSIDPNADDEGPVIIMPLSEAEEEAQDHNDRMVVILDTDDNDLAA